MTDLNPAPDNILRFIRCNCNSLKKNPCSNNVCSCKKYGLVCISAVEIAMVLIARIVKLKLKEILMMKMEIFLMSLKTGKF